MSAQDLVSQGYTGYAGWSDVEADADFAATQGAGKGSPNAGGGGYDGGIDMSNVPSVQGFVEGQFAGEDVAMNNLVAEMRSQEKPLDMYGRLETEAGLPSLKKASSSLTKEIQGIEDVLDTIEPDVSARSRESLVTEAQRRGMVAKGKEPHLERLTKFGTALGRISGRIGEAERGIATKTELGMRGQEMELEPLKLRYSTLLDRNARTLTGFTADRQTTLDALYDKLDRTRQLSDMEWNLANTLGGEEREYKRALQSAAANAGYQVTGSESTDQLLGIVGDKAAEQIQFDRAQKNKASGTTIAKADAKGRLQNDVDSWARYDSLLVDYGDELSTSEIKSIYNQGPMADLYGPASESPERTSELQSGKFSSTTEKEHEGKIEYVLSDGTTIWI